MIEQGGEEMSYNYRKLRGRIVEKFGTQQAFAEAMRWSERTLSLKLNGKRFWKQPEITLACRLLEIPEDEVMTYFFNQNVQ